MVLALNSVPSNPTLPVPLAAMAKFWLVVNAVMVFVFQVPPDDNSALILLPDPLFVENVNLAGTCPVVGAPSTIAPIFAAVALAEPS